MSWDLTPKPVSESEVVLVQHMELVDANLSGNVHGGAIMRLVDTAAGISAHKHCGGRVVTVAMDEMSFLEPIFVGEVVTVRAMVNDVGRTSMEVGVRVDAENFSSKRKVHSSSAYLVFVALDENGKPREVPPIVAESDVELQRQREAKVRREARLQRKAAIQAARGSEEEA
jgi:uncharacterized protein (TIGR00369 family)